MASRRLRQRINLVLACVAALTLLVLFRKSFVPVPHTAPPTVDLEHGTAGAKLGDNDVEMVIASMKRENVTWLNDYLLDWKKNIYVVDDPSAELTVPVNKGREAMVFLTYIIDRYDSLPGSVIFHHAERFQWHNDNLDYDALPLLQRFRFQHLKEEGYINLRCVWVLGCPAEIKPIQDATPGKKGEPVHAKHVYKGAFEELFPSLPVPETIGVTCCSQFAVRRETIRKKPKEEYIRYREWLTTSPLGDDLSGRVLEYSWHVIFGKESVHCPHAGECYCQTYGLCDMKCEENGCDNQYLLPPYATLPKGWPQLGWKGEDRGWSGLP
ncbi:Fc.00g107940.m01.CDS01 [Cosmosporella sp. VM-42]